MIILNKLTPDLIFQKLNLSTKSRKVLYNLKMRIAMDYVFLKDTEGFVIKKLKSQVEFDEKIGDRI